jgi:hypothetical protein
MNREDDSGSWRLAAPLLVAAFLLPNLGALFGGFLLDDMPVIVDNDLLHSLSSLPDIWTSPYWPDRSGLTLYRPFTRTVWTLVWVAGGGAAWAFHLVNLALGAAIVLLLHRLLLRAGVDERVSFLTVFLFALFPIHTEATTSIVGMSELLAAALGLASLHCFVREKRSAALVLFAFAVLSKESAAALPAIAWIIAKKPRMRFVPDGAVAAGVIGVVLWARHAVAAGPQMIPAVDNPMSLLGHFQRVLTALWVQCLYVWKTLVPVTLSADYSYKQIPLVMGLHDDRAWAGIALLIASAVLLRRKGIVAAGVATWWILFLPGSNLLFPVGTVMAERLAYLPSAGLALAAAAVIARVTRKIDHRAAFALLALVFLVYGARTAVRNVDWLGPDRFYPKLVETAPDSAKAWYFYGTWRAWKEDDDGAVEAYDRSLSIMSFYTEPLRNKANALVRLGRREEAIAAYREVLRYEPGNVGAATNLSLLLRGVVFHPSRPDLSGDRRALHEPPLITPPRDR